MSKLPEPTIKDVAKVLTDFFKNKKIFTKYDVTKQLRHNGFFAVHNKIRSLLDDELVIPSNYFTDNLINYFKDNLTLPGNPVVFCPNDDSIDNYDPNEVQEFNKNTVKVKPTSSKCTVKNHSLFDKRNRYSVKAKDTRDAGFIIGEEVGICTKNNSIVITEPEFALKDDKKATVDCYYNIRIPKVSFIKAFGKIPLSIKTKIRTNEIKILEN